MKAVKLTRNTAPDELQLSDVEEPQAGPGEVLIRLEAAALNHRDLGRLDREPDVHFILGSDGAGVIETLGPGVAEWAPGAEVIIYPSLNWGDREEAFSEGFTILGGPSNGTLAEAIAVPAANIFPKPAHLSFEGAGALPLAGLTAYRAVVSRAAVQPGERVLVHGIGGGVALFALQFALARGAEVMVTSTHEDKLERARKLGASLAVNSRSGDWQEDAQHWTGGQGLDVIVDSVGGELFAKSLLALRLGGRLVTYGATAARQATVDIATIYWNQLNVLGSTMGSPRDFSEMLELVIAHRLKPVIDSVWPLAMAPQALQHLAQGRQFGKIVLNCRQSA